MRAKNASVVINPRTGQNIAKITDVLAVLSAAGWKTNIAIKEYGGHTMELANEAANDGRNLVIAYGGDGTVNQVVNGVMTSRAPHSIVGVIPGGTANVWAGEVGIPIDPVKAALSLVNSEARRVDIGHMAIENIAFTPESDSAQTSPEEQKTAKKKIKTSKGSKKGKHHFLLMAGLGIDAAIMGNVSKPLKYRIGPLAVGLSAAKELPSHRSFPIEIRTGNSHETEPLWKGEAAQVVIGNTRRYGDIAEMTPDAYIDDGVLDVCVITAGDPLSTMQQLSSLLLRRKPDNLSAEYFHGAHLSITVPASVPMQLDGSAVKLKDYLEKADYEAIQQAPSSEHIMITYRFDALPHALEVAIPNAYNDALFESSNSRDETAQNRPNDHANEHESSKKSHVKTHHHKHEDNPQTEPQMQTEAEEVRATEQLTSQQEDSKKKEEDIRKELPGLVHSLLTNGRKVTVVGKAPNPEKKDTYIIAGGTVKQATGETKPVAVIVNGDTTILNREGERVTIDKVRGVQEGMVLIVEGKKSKRGVIEATRMVM